MTGGELDREVRAELRTLPTGLATPVARHLVMVGRLMDEDPALAWQHAQAARRSAGRVAAVREAAGVAAYLAGDYAAALSELRAARRMSGTDAYLPIMADCERGLGRPERALELASSPQARTLDRAGRVELLIVAAGARRDLGQADAAVVMLEVPELKATTREPWLGRLRYAYADALDAVGRADEARTWFEAAAQADPDGSTGAAERLGLADEDDDAVVFLVDLDEDGA